MVQFPEEMRERAYKSVPVNKIDPSDPSIQKGWVVIAVERFNGRGSVIAKAAHELFLSGVPQLYDNNENDVVMQKQVNYLSLYTLKVLNEGLLNTFLDDITIPS